MRKIIFLFLAILMILPAVYSFTANTTSYNVSTIINTVFANATTTNYESTLEELLTTGESSSTHYNSRFGLLSYTFACQESWTCTAWSTCQNSLKTKVCTDANSCGTTASKPPESSSCTSTGNTGGGGAGGSANTSSLPKVSVIISEIKSDESATVEVSSDLIGVYEAVVNVSHRVENVKFTFESLDTKPANASLPKSNEEVFEYLDIKHNTQSSNLLKIKLKFKVSKSWLEENDIDEDLVKMFRFTVQWDELPTVLDDEDSDYFYYEAETPGFSFFKISAITPEKKPVIPKNTTNQTLQNESSNQTTDTASQSNALQNNTVSASTDAPEPAKAKIDSRFFVFWGVGIVLVVALILFFSLKRKKEPAQEINLFAEENAERKLEEYLRRAKQKNADMEATKQELIKVGWKKEIVEKAIKNFEKKN